MRKSHNYISSDFIPIITRFSVHFLHALFVHVAMPSKYLRIYTPFTAVHIYRMKSTPKNDTNIVPTMLCTTREVYGFSVINNEATDRSPTAATPVQTIYNNTRIQMMYLFIFMFFLRPYL
jgi:hypothetical protein